MDITQYEVIGFGVIALAAIFGLIKYIVDFVNKQNESFKEITAKQNETYNKLNDNIIKNTYTLNNLNKYIEKMEKDFRERLDKHEERLDNHDLAISRLERSKDD